MARTTRGFITLISSLLLGAIFSVASGPAEAQAQALWCSGAGCLISTSTSTSTTGTTAAVIYLIVRPKNQSSAHLAAYLDANRVAVQEALVLESGSTRDDLITLMIGEHDAELAAAFGRALRAEREKLSSVLDTDGPLDTHHAQLFAQIIHQALNDDMTAP